MRSGRYPSQPHRRQGRARIRLGRMSADPATWFPGESSEYGLARNRLLEEEIELRRTIERVAAQRRALPPGGAVQEDYVFEEAADGGGAVKLSQLFAPGKDTLVIYSFMFPRWSGDTRPGPAGGETARLPRAQTPCPSCTSILDSLDGAAPHLFHRLNLVVVAKSDPARIRTFARERGWRQLRLLSSRNNTYNRDYHAETPEGEQADVRAPRRRRRAPPRRLDLADLECPRHDAGRARNRAGLPRAALRVALISEPPQGPGAHAAGNKISFLTVSRQRHGRPRAANPAADPRQAPSSPAARSAAPCAKHADHPVRNAADAAVLTPSCRPERRRCAPRRS
jgi:predicted dithiol-disulfide oxidoreductase (DUF899 family)